MRNVQSYYNTLCHNNSCVWLIRCKLILVWHGTLRIELSEKLLSVFDIFTQVLRISRLVAVCLISTELTSHSHLWPFVSALLPGWCSISVLAYILDGGMGVFLFLFCFSNCYKLSKTYIVESSHRVKKVLHFINVTVHF